MILLAAAAAWGATVQAWDFESDDGGFAPAGDLPLWAWDEFGSGPLGAHSGQRGWATAPGGNYANDVVVTLTFPPVDLSGLARPAVSWWHWIDVAPGDAGTVEAWDGAAWVPMEPVYGYPDPEGFVGTGGAWVEVAVDLSGLASLDALRLAFRSDTAVTAAGWYVDDVALHDGDALPPSLDGLTLWEDTEDLEGPYRVEVIARDDLALESVDLLVGIDGAAPTPVPMLALGDDRYAADIPAQPPGTELAYQVRAEDGEHVALLPEDGPWTFRVRLPAPEGLAAPEGRVVGTEVTLTWDPPDSEHAVLGYRVYGAGEQLLAEPTGTGATVPLLVEGPNPFSVSARYEAGEGDRSPEVVVDAVIPGIVSLEPPEGHAGDRLRVLLTGHAMSFVQGDAGVEMGPGVAVESATVIDVDRLEAIVAIDPDAAPGPRDVNAWSGPFAATLEAGFEVLDHADRPCIVSVTPTGIRQGESLTFSLSANRPLAASPTVEAGEGLVVEGVDWDGGTQLAVDVTATPDAALGPRTFLVDDGQHILAAPPVEVRDQPSAQVRCGLAPRGGGWMSALAAVLVARRRRLRRPAPAPR